MHATGGGPPPDHAPSRNLELKVKCEPAALEAARARLTDAGIVLRSLRQVDTYFCTGRGRLKLRETDSDDGPPTAELIAYARPNEAGPRWSDYRIVPIAIAQAPMLKAVLAEAVGLQVVVTKIRQVARHRRTRVHLDVVEDLGAFIELETVVGDGPDAAAEAELAEVAALIGLHRPGAADGADVVAGSYADLLLAAGDGRSGESPSLR